MRVPLSSISTMTSLADMAGVHLAGGVGGLLATEVGGVWYFPLYDNNGNITDYVSETGQVVASYAYDAFGRTIAQSGAMASVFPFRFSTKYYDAEANLYYYGNWHGGQDHVFR